MGYEAKMFPLSAKLALEGKLSGIKELLEKSFLPEFEHKMNEIKEKLIQLQKQVSLL